MIIEPMTYIETWIKCFHYIDIITTDELIYNNSLFSKIKFRRSRVNTWS